MPGMAESPGAIAEEIIGAHAGRKVSPGEVVTVPVDACMATDGSAPLTIDLLEPYLRDPAAGDDGDPLRIPGGVRARAVFVKDHYVPCPNEQVARLHQRMDRFAAANGVEVSPCGEGVCHRLLPEKGFVLPGTIVAGADSHSTTYGALCCMGVGIGSSDLAGIMLTGRMWMRVPGTTGIRVEGTLREGVYPKDLALYLVGTFRAGGADYRALEFYGPGLEHLDMEARFTICNMMAETGAKAALMPPDEVARKWLEQNGPDAARHSVSGITSALETVAYMDPDEREAAFDEQVSVDSSSIEPLIAAPHAVDNVAPVAQWAGRKIDAVVLGTCTNSSLADLRLAGEMLRAAHVAPGVTALVVPASRAILTGAAREGIVADLVEAGAMVLPPGCGPCCGALNGVPGDAETVISTANRNFVGRMGNVKSGVFLASTATAVASAIEGRIADPRAHLPERRRP